MSGKVRIMPGAVLSLQCLWYQMPSDMTMALDRIVPESMPWLHTDEGPE